MPNFTMNNIQSNALGVLAWNIKKPLSAWQVWKELRTLGYNRNTVKYNLEQLKKDGLVTTKVKKNKRGVKTVFYIINNSQYICFNGSMIVRKKIGDKYTYIIVGCPYASECPFVGTKFELDEKKCRLMRELREKGLKL